MKVASLAFSLSVPILSLGQIPEPVLPQGVGVNIHFVTGRERDLDLIAAAGFKFIRMDFAWEATERSRGVYEWSGYDELTKNLEKRGLRPVYIFDYSHRLYEDEVEAKNPITGRPDKDIASPRKLESVAAFAQWAAAAAAHFKGRGVIWEIWNEPNISFWKPKPDVTNYTALALATCKAVRAADPKATIIAPASSGFPSVFMDRFLASGVLKYLDGVSVHPYRDYKKSPETAAADYAKLRTLIDRYALGAKKGKMPILSGEWGYATHDRGLSLETQAAFAARQQLANLLNHVPLSIWYDWQNDGGDPKEREHNFGVVFGDLKPKPAYIALQTMTRELSGFRIVERHSTGCEEDYVLVLRNRIGTSKLAAWTTGQSHSVTLKLRGRAGKETTFRLVRSTGEVSGLPASGGRLVLDLTAAPCYVTFGTTRLTK